MPIPSAGAAEPVRLLAAGSLRAAFTGLPDGFGLPVEAGYGASGLLRQRIEAGVPADLFASADPVHPRVLGRARGRPFVPSPATGSAPHPAARGTMKVARASPPGRGASCRPQGGAGRTSPRLAFGSTCPEPAASCRWR